MKISKTVSGLFNTLARTWRVFTPVTKRWLFGFSFGLPFIIGVQAWLTTMTHKATPMVWAYDHWIFEAVGYGAMMMLTMSSSVIFGLSLLLLGTERWKGAGRKVSHFGTEAICGAGFMIVGPMLAVAVVDVLFNHLNPWEWSLVLADAFICFMMVYLARLPQDFNRRTLFDRTGAIATGVLVLTMTQVLVGHMIQSVDLLHM